MCNISGHELDMESYGRKAQSLQNIRLVKKNAIYIHILDLDPQTSYCLIICSHLTMVHKMYPETHFFIKLSKFQVKLPRNI